MNQQNEHVYPITHKLEQDLIDAGVVVDHPTIRMMIEAVGEYEHDPSNGRDLFMGIDLLFGEAAEAEGELDAEDLERQKNREALMAYAAVTMDLILIINGQI